MHRVAWIAQHVLADDRRRCDRGVHGDKRRQAVNQRSEVRRDF
jgi:hypothetical protein